MAINSWLPYEIHFIRQCLLHGYNLTQTHAALARVNARLKRPPRTVATIKTHCAPYRKVAWDYKRFHIAETLINGWPFSRRRLAKKYDVSETVVKNSIEAYSTGKLDYLKQYYPNLKRQIWVEVI